MWGGKITTFRKLAEQAADQLCDALQVRAASWTVRALLPGGDLTGWIGPSGRPDADIARFQHALSVRRPELTPALCRRWSRSYGALVQHLLDDPAGLGAEVAPGLYEAELRYLCDREWARERRRRVVAPQQARPASERKGTRRGRAAGSTIAPMRHDRQFVWTRIDWAFLRLTFVLFRT